ncbi:MAG: hypothetical protein MUC77_10630 [Chromatiaceae bacterium]|nr:hypothetical protein [Chromatiaceae bacterium]
MESDPRFELMAPVNLSLVCFRLRRSGASEAELARLNAELLERVNAGGRVYLTHTALKGRYAIRMAIGQRTTTERHVREAWELLTTHAASL